MIRAKAVDTNSTLQALLTKLDLEVQELRRKLNIPCSEHIHTKKLTQLEREKRVFTDSLTQMEEEITQKDKEIAGLNKRLSGLQLKWGEHTCVVLMPEDPKNALEQLAKALANLRKSEDETHTTRRLLDEAKAA